MLQLDTERIRPATLRLPTDQSYWNFTSAFGGWVSAVVVQLVSEHAEFRGEVITVQMQFVRPVAAEQLDVTLDLLARRSNVDFWRAEVRSGDGELLVTSEVTAGHRRDSGASFETAGPSVEIGDGALMDVDELRPVWMAHFDQWMIEGEPFTVAERPRSVVRVRPAREVEFDASVLAMVCDTPMPRTFFASTDLLFASTLALSTHIYVTDDEIGEVGTEGVVIEADSATIRNNTLNQEARIFRMDGLLLATSYQTAVFRPLELPT